MKNMKKFIMSGLNHASHARFKLSIANDSGAMARNLSGGGGHQPPAPPLHLGRRELINCLIRKKNDPSEIVSSLHVHATPKGKLWSSLLHCKMLENTGRHGQEGKGREGKTRMTHRQRDPGSRSKYNKTLQHDGHSLRFTQINAQLS